MKLLSRFSAMIFLVMANTVYAGDLQITVNNIHNDKGQLLIAIYDNPMAFKTEDADKMHTYITIPAKTNICTITLHDFPIGTYAISVLHDENQNSQFDMDTFQMPMEGYAYSNNVGLMATPSFQQASFNHKENTLMQIKLLYNSK